VDEKWGGVDIVSSSKYGGQQGRVVEIMGAIGTNLNERSWISPIKSEQ